MLAVNRNRNNTGDRPVGDSLLQPRIDRLGLLGLRRHRKDRRAEKGQEITPPHVALLLASFALTLWRFNSASACARRP
jgi:hypothetical protein